MSAPSTITVELGPRSYPIVIGHGLLAGGFDIGPHLSGKDCLVVSNETVAPLYLDAVRSCLGSREVSAIELPDGERYKTMESVARVLDRLVEMGANRDITVLALGGGVVGDIAGFASACYMRGVAFIQVPTTLLAQVDSSVGGKTGVNHPRGKNLIGAFHQPVLVLIDTATLETLPERELSAGLAEVIKYGVIADERFFAWLEDNIGALRRRDPAALRIAIERSCELKAAIVADDERENGRRAILNFGHTFGHAIERCQGYGEWLHGEAVAAGMLLAASLSAVDEEIVRRLRALLEAAGLPTSPPDIGDAELKAAMTLDKKVKSKQLRFVLLERLGSAVVSSGVDDAALDRLLAREARSRG